MTARPPSPYPAAEPPPGAEPPPAVPARRPLRVSIPAIVIGLAMVGSIAFIGYVVTSVEEEQIPLLAMGFVVLGASFAAIAVWSLVGVWRAASRALGGRSLGLSILGGLAALGAIGCFTVAALAALVWNT